MQSRFLAYADLAQQVDDEALTSRIDVPKHKTLAEHLWCVVGARESYAKALEAGSWAGFNCSMTNHSRKDFLVSLEGSAKAALNAINSIEEWTAERDELLAALAEHEVMHEGQIIRHIYGENGTLPSSWKWA